MGSEPFFFLIHVHCCNGTPAMWHQWHVDEDAKNMYLFREHICREDGSCKEMKRALPSVAVMGGMSRTDIIRNVKPNKGRYDKNSAKALAIQSASARAPLSGGVRGDVEHRRDEDEQ